MAPSTSIHPTDQEMAAAQEWFAAHLGPVEPELPFSFMYDGSSSQGLLPVWYSKRSSEPLDENREQHTLAWTDKDTGLEVRCVAVQYCDFPTVEWTVYFKNTGSVDTPFLDRIQAMDIQLDPGEAGEFLLHHFVGSPADRSDYAPLETPLPANARKFIRTSGGRSSNSDWPYFNIEWDGGGLIVVVGWPAQWAAEFHHRERSGLNVRAGQELTHLTLRPGEEIRTPLALLQFWNEGDWIRAQNVWRRWMMRHNLPRPGGRLPAPIRKDDADIPVPLYSAASCSYTRWMAGATEENQKGFIDRFDEEGIDIDAWWMDTGWYINNDLREDQLTDELRALREAGRLWEKCGIWQVAPDRFPTGLRPICDHAHAKGLTTIVWFEPERLVPPNWLTEARPEWCLTASTHPHRLLNFGHPDALEWLNDRIHQVLTEEAIDVYRVDFNFDPLDHWRQNDEPERQGALENHWAQGFLAHWDEMLRRNPELLIDTCASGGRRNDLETLRRSVPLWRSDRCFEPVSMQCHSYGISFWLPYNGAASREYLPRPENEASFWTPDDGAPEEEINDYAFRSCMYPHIHSHYDIRHKDANYDAFRRLFSQWNKVSPNYFGDYYPLTPYTTDADAWIAWQFDRPEEGEGVVQAFRRPDAVDARQTFPLRGLDSQATYKVADLDASEPTLATGADLAERGLDIVIEESPGAAVLLYRKCD